MSNLYDFFNVDFNAFIQELDCRATPVKLVRKDPTPRQLNEITLEPEAQTESELDLVAVVADLNAPLTDGIDVLKGDLLVLMDSQVEPFQEDSVLVDGFNYSIIDLKSINPGGVQIGWKLQVRR